MLYCYWQCLSKALLFNRSNFPPLIVYLLLFILAGCLRSSDDAHKADRWVRTQNANLRTDPLLLASVIDVLEQNTPLQVLAKSKEKVRIKKQLDHWYFVRLENKIEGWVYGSALTGKPVESVHTEARGKSKTSDLKAKNKASKNKNEKSKDKKRKVKKSAYKIRKNLE